MALRQVLLLSTRRLQAPRLLELRRQLAAPRRHPVAATRSPPTPRPARSLQSVLAPLDRGRILRRQRPQRPPLSLEHRLLREAPLRCLRARPPRYHRVLPQRQGRPAVRRVQVRPWFSRLIKRQSRLAPPRPQRLDPRWPQVQAQWPLRVRRPPPLFLRHLASMPSLGQQPARLRSATAT